MIIRCQWCHKPTELPITETEAGAWMRSGEKVQDFFPFLSADQRELLISKTCGACFDQMFPEDD